SDWTALSTTAAQFHRLHPQAVVAAQCKNLAHNGFVEIAEALSALATKPTLAVVADERADEPSASA
uniref:hypothetical protein n=1 Tax=Mycobacterium sp. TaxID=1785 RepID=UPI003F9D60EF